MHDNDGCISNFDKNIGQEREKHLPVNEFIIMNNNQIFKDAKPKVM